MRYRLFTFWMSKAQGAKPHLMLVLAAVAYLVTALGAHPGMSRVYQEDTLCKATGLMSTQAFDSDVDGNQSPDSSSVPMPDPALLPATAFAVPKMVRLTVSTLLTIPDSHILEVAHRPPESSRA